MTAPAVVHRLVYEATIDDAVDVAIRVSSKSKALQKQVRAMIIGTGILGWFAFSGVWIFYLTSRTPTALAIAVGGGAAFGVVFALIFRRFLATETRKQHRKIVAEQFGGKPSIPCELELRTDGVWVRQAGIEMSFPWRLCTAIEDHADDVEIDFGGGMCVVRNRDFASPAERRSFLEAARRLAER